ncbi:uncharacterized protein [Venturia canescens]|uniref:uncharacterized protein n=1 Tax=Venturia canescens TaxID=32260 RepID=UPI001C9D626D|nr:uncharacterized protein LOC122419285 [Venturia canescens]
MQRIIVIVCSLVLASASGENVSVDLVPNEFIDAVNRIGEPKKIAANVPTSEFALNFTIATTRLLNDVLFEYYRQARLASIILANDWKSSTAKLLKKSSHVTAKNSEYLDPYLKKVLNYMNKFLLINSF